MITDTKATIANILAAGGSLPCWIDRMDSKLRLRMIKAECRRCGIQPVPVL